MILLDLSGGDGRPIYSQIADRVKFAIAAGGVRPGELVPSVRELSKQLVVNPNTVARAYRELQGDGLLETVRGTGLQVAEGAVDRCRQARRDFVRTLFRAAFEEAERTRLDPAEIEAIVREEAVRQSSAANGESRTHS